MTYVTYLFGFPVGSFRIRTILSWLLFHGLDISAVLVSAGISLALWRRMRDRGALALQDFAADFLPLLLLFAISVTGLALTASTLWLRGRLLRISRDPSRDHGHRRAALPSVREVLPYLPAAGSARRQALPAAGDTERACTVPAAAGDTPPGCR